MNQTIDIGIKLKDRILNKYRCIEKGHIPENYSLGEIEYRKEDIERYHVVFWHRLLRTLYEEPTLVECEVLSEKPINNVYVSRSADKTKWKSKDIDRQLASDIQTGKAKLRPIDWNYYVRLPSGGIIVLSTERRCTNFRIEQIIVPEQSNQDDVTQAKQFIDLLLAEANRMTGQLFNPKKEYERKDSTKTYLLFNVYLANYLSAQSMLETAISKEEDLNEGFVKDDANKPDIWKEKKELMLKYLLIRGTYFCSSITYYFMALEGFVNLVYHAFLKKKFRDENFRMDQRLDLEQKIKFMPSLCQGFDEDSGLPDSICSDFRKLKNYRNSLFHSKVEDSLKTLTFIEDGFLYIYDMNLSKNHYLPSFKGNLTIEDVNDVKNKVDDIITSILQSMNEENRCMTEKYLMKEPILSFRTSDSGETLLI